MGTTQIRELTVNEKASLVDTQERMKDAGALGVASRFTFFAGFDGTNNDRANLQLSGDPYSTNVAALDAQAEKQGRQTLVHGYYKGVGTGGDQGGLPQAAVLPSSAVDAAAEKAYSDFRIEAMYYLDNVPGASPADLGVAITAFSRGCPAGIRFAQLLEERGLKDLNGDVVAKPGEIPVTAMALMDPVDTFVKGPMHIPQNVQGQVLVVKAEHEMRTEFRPMYFDDDPRVTTVWHPGNHVGIGGGYDEHGTAANVLEGVTGYFQNRGIAIADVAPERRHDPDAPHHIYTEAWQTARNGDKVPDHMGRDRRVWREDNPSMGRVEVYPETPPEHKAWLAQLRASLAPPMADAGYSAEQCDRVARDCLARAVAQQAALSGGSSGSLPRFMLSQDGQRMGAIDQAGVLSEWPVSESLGQTGGHEAAERAPQPLPEPVPAVEFEALGR